MTTSEILSHLRNVKQNGNGWMASCPGHNDINPSLSIKELADGRTLLHCHAGCETERVVAAMGLKMSDLFPAEKGFTMKQKRVVATYDYHDEDGELVYRMVRYEPKEFKAQRRNGTGWISGMGEVEPILYRLPQTIQAVKEFSPIFVAEGEQDVDRLASLGLNATTNPFGADAWKDEYSPVLKGAHVVVLQDNDEAGADRVIKVACSLFGVAASIRILLLPNLPEKGDVSDWLDNGGTKEELIRLAGARPKWQESEASKKETAGNLPPGSAVMRMVSEVTPERVYWLWPGRIPAGKLVILDGDPEVGKGVITMDIAARVSTGSNMPDGAESELTGPGGVVIVGVEDAAENVIRPRLEAAGADIERIVLLDGITQVIRSESSIRMVTLCDLKAIEQSIQRVNARIAIIDPLMAFVPAEIDSHKDQQIRQLLTPLAALAERTGCTILVVRHLNKTVGEKALYRGIGSIGIVGVARSAMVAAIHPWDPTEALHAFGVTKCNLGKKGKALAYRIEDPSDAKRLHVSLGQPIVVWYGEMRMTANELLNARKLSPEQQDIIGVLTQNGEEMDAPTIAKELEKDTNTITQALRRMERDEVVQRTRTGFYIFAPYKPFPTSSQKNDTQASEGLQEQAGDQDARGDIPPHGKESHYSHSDHSDHSGHSDHRLVTPQERSDRTDVKDGIDGSDGMSKPEPIASKILALARERGYPAVRFERWEVAGEEKWRLFCSLPNTEQYMEQVMTELAKLPLTAVGPTMFHTIN